MANLLVVEDDPDVADSLKSVLQDEGHDIRIARDGSDGLGKVTEALPDLVLLDVEMPVLNGPDMAYEMFVLDCGREEVPIVLLSGAAGLREIAARVGTPYYQAKPYRIAVLLRLVQRALAERCPPVPLQRESA